MDILLGKDGKVKFDGFRLSITDELPDKVAQRLFIRLRSSKGHWFMDKTYGVEWLNAIFGKRKTQAAIDTILQNENVCPLPRMRIHRAACQTTRQGAEEPAADDDPRKTQHPARLRAACVSDRRLS